MKPGLTALSLVLSLSLSAQWWADAGIDIDHNGELRALYVDSVDNTLYCTGALIQDWGQPTQSFRYAALLNGNWTLSEPLGNVALTVVNFHDTLFVGGDFNTFGGLPIVHLACRVNGVWQACGNFNAGINRMKVVDGELYALGNFSNVDGLPCKGIVKRSGGDWVIVGDLSCNQCRVGDLVKYQGRLVASGIMPFNGFRHVVQLVNGAWQPVGPQGLYGGFDGGGPLVIYHGDLYLGGSININAGNAGHGLMRWDGAAWHQVGAGLQDENDNTNDLFAVHDLLVHDDKLFVCGGFTYAGHVPANRIATWDGVQWCSVGGNFGDDQVTAMAYYNDTLYAAAWSQADGLPVQGVAKFIAPAFENNCSGTTAVAPVAGGRPLRLVSQGHGSYLLQGFAGRGALEVFGALGQLMAQRTVAGGASFALEGLPTGVCIARLPDGTRQRFVVE